ncbi:MAG: hypothetical protein ABFS35_03090 [Bacteroidota bacterium]
MIFTSKMKMFSILFMLISINAYSQTTATDEHFPDDWLGTYKGKMYIIKQGKGIIDSADVKLELLATNISSQWVYRMTYNNSRYREIIKDYLLVKPDSVVTGSYLLDEKDGIIIQQTLLGNTFYSSFTVAGDYINSIMRKTGNVIEFEVFSARKKESLSTKNRAKEGQIVFEVKSYPPFTTQRVRLIKEN